MTERVKKHLKNMINIFDHIIKYQNSDTKIYNKDETKDTILYHYDSDALISSVYADRCAVNVFYNNKNQIREIMDHNWEFSLYVIYNEDNSIKYAFISNALSSNTIHIIGDDVTIVQKDPFQRTFYIYDNHKNFIEAYRDSADGLKSITEEVLKFMTRLKKDREMLQKIKETQIGETKNVKKHDELLQKRRYSKN